MNKIPNRQAICEALMARAEADPDIVVLCSDSRGSASLAPFFQTFPGQSVEVGIAEQDLVGIAAGLASCGKKAWCASPASFLSTRSYEQCKVDVAYSRTNVKLIGISGGVSYGALGMSHHSAQDIAAMSAIPDMRVYLPSDRHQTRKLVEALLSKPTQEAAALLEKGGVSAAVLDMYCVKPLDTETLLRYARQVKAVVTVEEHAPTGGLGSMVAQAVAEHCPKKVKCLALPDAPVITGTSKEVFEHYGLNASGIAKAAEALLK